MLTLTLRGLRAHKRRLISTVIAVMLGVGFMAGSLVFTDTMRASLAGVFSDAERETDALVRGPVTFEGWNGNLHQPVDEALVADIAALPQVADVAPRVEGFAQVVRQDGEPIDDIGKGAAPAGVAWSDAESLNPFQLVEGSAPRAGDEVVIDRSLAEEAQLSVGDRTTVLTTAGRNAMTVVGVATFGKADNRAGNRTVLFDLSTAQRLLGREGTVDGVAVAAAAGTTQVQLVKAIEGALGESVDAITGAALAEENKTRKNEDVDFFGTFMKVFAAVALLVGAFIINNTFAILIAQRTRELALLRAIGASARQVRRSVRVEALVIGVLASAAGLLAGVGVARGLQALWKTFGVTMPDGPLVVQPSSLLLAFTIGVVVTVGSALLPARRAAKVAPVEAMRSSQVEASRPSRVRIAVGTVLTAGAAASVIGGVMSGSIQMVLLGALAAFIGVATLSPVLARPVVGLVGLALPKAAGIRGQLARENALRNPRRTAATASALMIGVALVGAITVFAASGKWSIGSSFDKEFRGDLVLETGAWMYGGASPALSEQLGAIDEVAVAVPRQFSQAEVDGKVRELAGWPAATVEKAFDLGVSSGSLAEMGSDGIAMAARYADEQGIALGDSVPVTFPNGTEQSFEVRALFDHPDWTGQIWVDRSAFAAAVPEALDTTIYVVGADGVGTGALREAIEPTAAGYGNVEVLNRAELRQAVADAFNAMLGVVYALLALALLIALIGIGNTVSLAVVERTRELGLLRAVGMSRAHLRGMVRWEAALVAVYGTLLGLGIGLFLGWTLVFAIRESGIETAKMVIPTGQLAIIVLLAASAGVLAALLPARRAARTDVLTAIATE